MKQSGGKAVRSQIIEMEGKLSDAMSEIKLALDALRKSMAKAAPFQSKAAEPVEKDENETDNREQDQEPCESSGELDQQEICDLVSEAKEEDDDW